MNELSKQTVEIVDANVKLAATVAAQAAELEKVRGALRGLLVRVSPQDDPAPFAAKGIPVPFEVLLAQSRAALASQRSVPREPT